MRDLFDDPEERTFQERFEEFHRDNPHVYRRLVKLTRDLKGRGHNRIGMRMLWEVLRWQSMMRTLRDEGDYKLNDHYHARYARRIMEQEPDLDGVFELRRLKRA
jgi:hypothetical protein